MAICLLRLKRYDESAQEWNEAVRAEPKDHLLFVYRGITLLAAGKLKEAAADLNNFLKLENWQGKDCPETMIILYQVHRLDHNERAAADTLAVCKQQLKKTKDWSDPLSKYALGRITADQLIKSAGKDSAKRTDAYTYLGLDYLASGKSDEARKYFQRAADIEYPESFEYQLSVAFLQRLQKSSGIK